MAISYERIKELSVLSQGVACAWVVQDGAPVFAPNGPPTDPTDGVELSDALLTSVAVMADIGTKYSFRIWLLVYDGPGLPGGWVVANGGIFEDVELPWTDRLITAGYQRIYVEVTDTDDMVGVLIGPSTLAVSTGVTPPAPAPTPPANVTLIYEGHVAVPYTNGVSHPQVQALPAQQQGRIVVLAQNNNGAFGLDGSLQEVWSSGVGEISDLRTGALAKPDTGWYGPFGLTELDTLSGDITGKLVHFSAGNGTPTEVLTIPGYNIVACSLSAYIDRALVVGYGEGQTSEDMGWAEYDITAGDTIRIGTPPDLVHATQCVTGEIFLLQIEDIVVGGAPDTAHTISSIGDTGTSTLWSRTDIRATRLISLRHYDHSTSTETVLLVCAVENGLVCLDGETGDTLWQATDLCTLPITDLDVDEKDAFYWCSADGRFGRVTADGVPHWNSDMYVTDYHPGTSSWDARISVAYNTSGSTWSAVYAVGVVSDAGAAVYKYTGIDPTAPPALF